MTGPFSAVPPVSSRGVDVVFDENRKFLINGMEVLAVENGVELSMDDANEIPTVTVTMFCRSFTRLDMK